MEAWRRRAGLPPLPGITVPVPLNRTVLALSAVRWPELLSTRNSNQ